MKKFLFVLLVVPFFLFAQSSWKPAEVSVPAKVELFHSSKTANFPTTESLNRGDFMYEISHRFGMISKGYEELYGFDGPVKMRMALSYGITNDLMMTIGRSNVLDNLELTAKYKLLEFDHPQMPSALSVKAGWAMNTEPSVELEAFNTNYMQYYGQLVYNIMFMNKKLGLGIVPSLIYNSNVFAKRNNLSVKNTITLGTYYQFYINRMWSLFAEFSPVLSGWDDGIFASKTETYNIIAFGAAIETGGHIFHLFITNSTLLNSTQFLTGADNNTDKDAWHLGFGITREL